MKKMKQILTSAFAGAAMLAVVGTASAAQVDINIYGASAQYLYWTANAAGILGGMGCTGIQEAAKDAKNSITKGTCGSDTVYIRVASKSSFEGPRSVMGDDTNDNYTAPAERGSDGFSRQMVDETTCTFSSTITGAPTSGCTGLKSERITLGVSDVAAKSFNQNSTGELKGPALGGSITRTFAGVPISGLNSYNPVVVPFAFFANKTVKQDPTYVANGNVYNPANAVTITNIPRMMAVMIFSGQAYNWTDFGHDFANVPVVACLRHAGSGTHSALDYAVMNSKWGANLVIAQHASNPTVWFNDGSGDEMFCINTLNGAIGYADADQSTSSYSNTVRLNYNGAAPSRANIRNGQYDFFTMEWAYESQTSPNYSVTHPYVAAAMAFAADPAHIPSAKAPFWATGAEMNFMKDSDQNYSGYIGCATGSCQLP